MAYEPLHHKYRPQTFAELVGQEAIASTLTNALRQQKIAPAYLFTGARGTGKTSSARILAKSLNCLNSDVPTEKPCGICEVCRAIANGSALDVIEIDAASNTGVDNIRELIERSQFAPVQARYKVYVIDECHMLSTAAFNALLKTLEEPPDRVVFVLATTDPQRVLPTIISRCQRFDFRRIPLEAMVNHLRQIANQETIAITPDAIQLVSQISQGGLRDAESLLDQLSLLEGQITSDRVWDLVGAVPERDLLALIQAIAADEPTAVIDQARHLMDRGREPLTVLQNLASFYRDLLIAKATPDRVDLVAITPSTWTALCQFAQTLDISTILRGQQHLRESELQVRNTTQPRLWLEVALLSLLPAAIAPASVPITAAPIATSPESQVPSPKPAVQKPPVVPQTPPAVPEAKVPEAQPSNNHRAVPLVPIVLPPAQSAAQATSDLVKVWDELIANMQPPGTQMLLRQQGRLLAFDGQEAKVGFTSQPLFKMAIERAPNIEASFAKVYGRKIRVTLEVVAIKPEANGSAEPSEPATPEVRSLMPRAKETSADFAAEPLRPAAQSDAPVHPEGMWQSEDEVSRAAKSLAQMFNGQLVTLEDSLMPTAIALPLNPEADLLSSELDDADEDVPF